MPWLGEQVEEGVGGLDQLRHQRQIGRAAIRAKPRARLLVRVYHAPVRLGDHNRLVTFDQRQRDKRPVGVSRPTRHAAPAILTAIHAAKMTPVRIR